MKITVFTPTYNRAYIIEKLYRSLCLQTYYDFEWLVVDDGSTDNTEALFEKWKLENNRFQIRYYRKENGGKCRAINYALGLAQGELFFTVDSDDYLTDDALEKIIVWEKQLPKDERFCGVVGNKGVSKNKTTNHLFAAQYFEGTFLDRYGMVDGERAEVFYTHIHKQYLYPEFDNEKFMTESVVWNRMARDGYKMRFYNDIIYIFAYREDGLTRAGTSLFINNPRGYGLWLREKAELEKISLKEKIKMYYTFTCDLSGKYKSERIAESINVPKIFICILQALHKFRGSLKDKRNGN